MSNEKPRKTARSTPRRKKSAGEVVSTPSAGAAGANEEPVLSSPPTVDGRPSEANDEEEIRRRAYELYVSRGGVDGGDLSDWLEAERLVRRSRRSEGDAGPENIPPSPPSS